MEGVRSRDMGDRRKTSGRTITNPALRGGPVGGGSALRGRVAFRGCQLEYLVQQAWNLQPFQVSGGPGWTRDERFDIASARVVY